MSTENAPDNQVKDRKSKKRDKKKDILKDKQEDSELDKCEHGPQKPEKRKSKKRKSKDEDAPQDTEEAAPNEQDSHTPVSSKKVKPDTAAETKEDEAEDTKDKTKAPKQPSKRQLKREKAEMRENQKKEASKLEATQKALNYVSKWKHARKEWKFEKLRQIWLMDNLLDDTAIPDEMFLTVLEYFEGSKGMAREQLLKKGMEIMKKAEEDEENTDTILESVSYKRARQLLQALPTDT